MGEDGLCGNKIEYKQNIYQHPTYTCSDEHRMAQKPMHARLFSVKWNENMILYSELGRNGKKSVTAYFKAISQHYLEWQESHNKPYSEQPVTCLKFKLGISQIQISETYPMPVITEEYSQYMGFINRENRNMWLWEDKDAFSHVGPDHIEYSEQKIYVCVCVYKQLYLQQTKLYIMWNRL
jgi:hypothetical protein